jgi:hypothetical protein
MNAKKEFLEHIGSRTVKCAAILLDSIGDHISEPDVIANLLTEYTQEDFDQFIEKLNLTYNNGYGGQQLFGTIWYTDGTWSTRGEYDGSEWWEYHKCPEITFYELKGS